MKINSNYAYIKNLVLLTLVLLLSFLLSSNVSIASSSFHNNCILLDGEWHGTAEMDKLGHCKYDVRAYVSTSNVYAYHSKLSVVMSLSNHNPLCVKKIKEASSINCSDLQVNAFGSHLNLDGNSDYQLNNIYLKGQVRSWSHMRDVVMELRRW